MLISNLVSLLSYPNYRRQTGKNPDKGRYYGPFGLWWHGHERMLLLYRPTEKEQWNRLCLTLFHLLTRKSNIDKFSIYSNKFFHNFHLSESSFTLWVSAKTDVCKGKRNMVSLSYDWKETLNSESLTLSVSLVNSLFYHVGCTRYNILR